MIFAWVIVGLILGYFTARMAKHLLKDDPDVNYPFPFIMITAGIMGPFFIFHFIGVLVLYKTRNKDRVL